METKAKLVKDLITGLDLSKEEALEVVLFLLSEKQITLFDFTKLENSVNLISEVIKEQRIWMEEQCSQLVALMQNKLNSLDEKNVQSASEEVIKPTRKCVVKSKSEKNVKSEGEQNAPRKGYSKNGKKLGRPKCKPEPAVSDTLPAQVPAEEPVSDTLPAQAPVEESVSEILPAQVPAEEPVSDTLPAQVSAEEPVSDTLPAQAPAEELVSDTLSAQEVVEKKVFQPQPPKASSEIIVSDRLLSEKIVQPERHKQKFLHKKAKNSVVLEQNRKEMRPSKDDIDNLVMGKVLTCKLLYQTKEGLHLSDRALNSVNPEGVQVPYRISGKFFVLRIYDEAQGMTLKEAVAYAKKLPRLNDRPWMVLTPQQKESCLAVKADLNEALKKVGGDLFDGAYLTNPPSYGKKGEKIRFAVEIDL